MWTKDDAKEKRMDNLTEQNEDLEILEISEEKRKVNIHLIKKIAGRLGAVLAAIVLMAVIGIMGVVLILEFGPSETARNVFVNSAMESSAGKFLVTMFFSKDQIEQIRKMNSVEETTEITDTSLLDFSNVSNAEPNEDPDGDGIVVIDVAGDTFHGKLMKVKDPSRVRVGISGNYGSQYAGKTVMQMAEAYGAAAAINGGGFEDANGTGNGGTPIGMVIADGELRYGSRGASYEMVGFDKNNVLVVGRMSGQTALDMGVRDAISFGPTLIVNGEPAVVNGSGSGMNPRTAIGQCSDGTVLLLVCDGRQVNSMGATYADLIDVLLKYGAVNASNLDGGSSSLMYYQGQYINNCSSLLGPREMPTCIIVK